MGAFGRYVEFIDVNSERVIIEIRVLESIIDIRGKQISTNKWLLPHHWQEVYYIIHTAVEKHMKSKHAATVAAQGKDTQVALVFKPFLPAHQYIVSPYQSNGGVVEALQDSGGEWLKSTPYKLMLIASVSPKCVSDISKDNCVEVKGHRSKSSINLQNRTRDLKIKYVADDKLYKEIIWQPVEDFQVLANDEKLKRGSSKDLAHAYMTTYSPPTSSDNFSPYNCDSNNGEECFPIEKYSKYTGAVTKQYIHPNSPEHVSLNNESKNDLFSEVESANSASFSEILTLRSRKNKNISNEHSSAKSKQRINCSSNSDDDRHHSSRKRAKSTCKEKLSATICRQKNTNSTDIEEDSCWEKETDVHNVSNTLLKDTSKCEKKVIRVRSKVDNENKTARDKKSSILKTDAMVKLFSLRDKNARNKCVRKCNVKESDAVKKEVSKLTNKRTGESDSAITHYFPMKNTKLISPSSSSNQSVRNSEEAITDVSDSDDYVPGTPIHTTRFGIQDKGKNENSSVKNTSSSGEGSMPLNSSVRIQRTKPESTYSDTDKSKSKNIPEGSKIEMTLGHYSKHTKIEKQSKLSARRNGQKSTIKVSTITSTGIPSYFRPVAEITEDATSATANENNCQLKHSPCQSINVPTRESLGSSDRLCRMSSLQIIGQQELKTTVEATNEGEVHNENLCSSSREEFGKRMGDSSLHSPSRKELETVPSVSLKNSGDSETDLKQEILTSSNNEKQEILTSSNNEKQEILTSSNNEKQEILTSSNNEKQDFRVLHLTLKQLEERFHENVRYLNDIMKGRKYCWRQEQFQKGGVYSDKLVYAVATVPYTVEQLDHLLLLLRGAFFRKRSFVTHFDYIMKVLLPEAAAKIFMDEFSLSYDEALSKIHNIYIISGAAVDNSLHWLPSDED